MKKIILILSLFWSIQSLAQSRILPISETTSSPYSLSLGGVTSGDLQSAYIYNNPSAIFTAENNSAEYSLGIIEASSENYFLHTVSAVQKINTKNALFVGAKFMSMGRLGHIVDEEMNYTESQQKPYSHSLNIGYAYLINEHLSLYSTMGYMEESVVTKIQAMQFNIGGNYAQSVTLFDREASYVVGASINNIGKYSYSNNTGAISPLARVGGSFATDISTDCALEVFLDFGWYLPTLMTETSPIQAMGVNCHFLDLFRVSLGGGIGDDNNHMSTGLGVIVAFVELDLAVKIPTQERGNHVYMFGTKFNF